MYSCSTMGNGREEEWRKKASEYSAVACETEKILGRCWSLSSINESFGQMCELSYLGAL